MKKIMCKVCKNQAKKIIIYFGKQVNLCSEHTKKLEIRLGEIWEPLTTLLFKQSFNSCRP